MEALVGASAVVDIATKDDLQAHHERLAGLLDRPHGRFYRAANAKAPLGSNHAFSISLGRPPSGKLWIVQYVILTGDDPTNITAIANTRAAVFVGSVQPDSGLTATTTLDQAGCIVPALAIPSLTNVPDKCIVHTDEELYAVLFGTGLSAGAVSYHFNAGLLELPQKAEALLW